MYSRKSVGPRKVLRNTNINWIFLWRLPIQKHSKLSLTEKKCKYLTLNFIRGTLMKKNNMPNPVESLGYIKCYSLSSPKPVPNPSNFIRYNCQKIYSWLKRPYTMLQIWNNLEKKIPSDTYWRIWLVRMKDQTHSSFKPPLEYSQDQKPLTNQDWLRPF